MINSINFKTREVVIQFVHILEPLKDILSSTLQSMSADSFLMSKTVVSVCVTVSCEGRPFPTDVFFYSQTQSALWERSDVTKAS